jgi:hypothetical protein
MTNVMVALRNFANAPKIKPILIKQYFFYFQFWIGCFISIFVYINIIIILQLVFDRKQFSECIKENSSEYISSVVDFLKYG